MFCIFVHYSTWSIYHVSMSFFCWPLSVDILTFCPVFSDRSILNSKFRTRIPTPFICPPPPPGTAGDNWRSSTPSLGWRRYLSDVIIFEWSYYLHLSPGGREEGGGRVVLIWPIRERIQSSLYKQSSSGGYWELSNSVAQMRADRRQANSQPERRQSAKPLYFGRNFVSRRTK